MVGAGGPCGNGAGHRAAGGHAFWYSDDKMGNPQFWRVAGAP